jgi:hypothetical protein
VQLHRQVSRQENGKSKNGDLPPWHKVKMQRATMMMATNSRCTLTSLPLDERKMKLKVNSTDY